MGSQRVRQAWTTEYNNHKVGHLCLSSLFPLPPPEIPLLHCWSLRCITQFFYLFFYIFPTLYHLRYFFHLVFQVTHLEYLLWLHIHIYSVRNHDIGHLDVFRIWFILHFIQEIKTYLPIFYLYLRVNLGLPWWLTNKEFACQSRRQGFDP